MLTRAYFDYAAATPTDPLVVREMQLFWSEQFGNPSSGHQFGHTARAAVAKAQKTVAGFIGAQTEEIYFTSSGTESNNLAILGVAKANRGRGNHIITTKIEHFSILNACRALEKDGFVVTYLPVDQNGLLALSDLQNAITPQTILVTTHYGNSEIGICQPIKEIGATTRPANILFHVDACQAAAYRPIDVNDWQADLLSFNGSKMSGPKGVAVLSVKDGTPIFPIFYGGGQQKSLRSGTENVPGIVGLAQACVIAQNRFGKIEKIKTLREQLQIGLEALGVTVNAVHPNRLPNHLSVTFPNFTAANLVEAFDQLGVAVASGSACSSSTLVDSHVLGGIGLTSDQINRTVRITLGYPTTAAECEQLVVAAHHLNPS